MTTTKPQLAKLIIRFAAKDLPDRIVTNFLDATQFALAEAFDFKEGFDLSITPDYTKSAAIDSDGLFENGLQFEIKAYRTKTEQALDLVAHAARFFVPRYTRLQHELKVADSWLPGFDFEEDQAALRWLSVDGFSCSSFHIEWVIEQLTLFNIPGQGRHLQELAGILREKRQQLLNDWQSGEDSSVDIYVLQELACLRVAPTDRLRAGVKSIAEVVLPTHAELPTCFVAEKLLRELDRLGSQLDGPAWLLHLAATRDGDAAAELAEIATLAIVDMDAAASLALLTPGVDPDIDRAILLQVALGGAVCSKLQAAWLQQQADAHAPHCSRAHWATPSMIAGAILKRWRVIEDRLTRCYTQHERTDPIPT